MSNSKPNWLLRSAAYRKARELVSKIINNPGKLMDLVADAQNKSSENRNGKIASMMEPVRTVYRLLRAYAAGEYRDISLESLALVVASIIYFLMPLDVIPDFIIGLGFIDDAALLAWTLRSVADDLERFINWEANRDVANDNSHTRID